MLEGRNGGIAMELGNYFSIWNKLTPGQRERIEASAEFRKAKKGTILHNGSMDCLGLLVIKSGQLRSYMLSPDGREITINRLFEMDVCLFSASCVMPSMQFEVIIEAEKDSELWIIPACLYFAVFTSRSSAAGSLLSGSSMMVPLPASVIRNPSVTVRTASACFSPIPEIPLIA